MLRIVGGDAEIYPRVLEERFPRVFERIIELWDSPEFDRFINGLFISDRGDRQGFPPEAMRELFKLTSLHDQGRIEVESDAWGLIDAKRGVVEQGPTTSIQEVFSAIEHRRDEVIERFTRSGKNVDIRDERGWTPLTAAAFYGNVKAAEGLLRAGADANAKDGSAYTPVHWGALEGHDKVVALLLKHGAYASPHSKRGITPLMQAAATGHLGVVKLLLANGAPPNAADEEGWTPLHKAVANGHLPVVKFLLAFKADPHSPHRGGTTPADIARKKRDPAMMQLLGVSA